MVPRRKSRLKLIHKCQYYRKIFRKGQLVLVDVDHRIPGKNGEWQEVIVRRDVPGFIAGMRGTNFLVELLEVVDLNEQKPPKEGGVDLNPALTTLKPAREIRRLLIGRHEVKQLFPVNVNKSSLIFN